MAFQILLQGQDITLHVDESTIQIEDVLGQGAGTGSESAGRAATCEFTTDLGPIPTAVGAGTSGLLTPYQNVIKSDNPLVYLPLNANALDASGNGRNGSTSGSPTFGATNIVVGEPDTSLDVSNGGFVSIPTSGLPTGSGPVTLEVWYKPTGTPAGGKFPGICSLGDAGTSHDFTIYHGGDGKLYVGSWNNDCNTALTVGKIYHIVAELSGGTVTVWLNGVQKASSSDPDTITAFACYIGKLADNGTVRGSQGALPGIVAHAAVYGSALSLSRIQAHYNAGATLYTPKLVRQGEVIITDATGNRVFGGFATDYKDATARTRIYTDVTCHDYWQSLDRIRIQTAVYDGQTDIYIIKNLLTTYAPWVDQSQLPSTSSYTFGPRTYTHFTLKKALENVLEATGYQMWIDPYKVVHYCSPSLASTAPFGLSSQPDFVTSFQMTVTEHEIDDSSAINRVYFYGGKHLSDDFTQDLSIQCNGTNDIFTLAYYPHKAKDGKFHLILNGHDYASTLGFSGGTGKANLLIKNGGTATVLLDIDAHTIYWNSAPAAGSTCTMKYRHEIPLIVVLTDQASYQYFGTYLDDIISDASVFDAATAIQRCKVLLLEQAMGFEHLTVNCWRPGIQSGQLLHVKESVRGIYKTYSVQKVTTTSLGAGNFQYAVELGAWNWNLVDILVQTARAATADDTTTTDTDSPVQVSQIFETVHVTDAVTKTTRTSGNYTYDTGVNVGKYGLSTYA